ncbi:MAG TPA: glutamate mutase L [Jatrophihabitans sp.]|nr:glutamate mutase L [Jatrophihabitans sp.]
MSAVLLVDIGSTVIKLCVSSAGTGLGRVERIDRLPDLPPGEQVRQLIEQRHGEPADGPVRVCSSAHGGLRVGILGLTRRHSTTAATRAALDAGGNVSYQALLGTPPTEPLPEVDVLVLVGGVDGADHRWLRTALADTKLADFPHGVLVWAGADAAEVLAALPEHRRVGNVLDHRLRAQPDGLTGLVRELYLDDLIDRKGLRALAGRLDGQLWPTPAAVGLAAHRLSRRQLPIRCPAPFVVVDVGGATTDVYYCTELGDAGLPAGSSIQREVYTDLGVVGSGAGLLARLAGTPDLLELVAAVAPDAPRALHYAIADSDPDALAPPTGFLSCLFLALRRLAAEHRLNLAAAAGFLITGGAWRGASLPAIRRVIAAAVDCRPEIVPHVVLDQDYLMWAYGLQPGAEQDG